MAAWLSLCLLWLLLNIVLQQHVCGFHTSQISISAIIRRRSVTVSASVARTAQHTHSISHSRRLSLTDSPERSSSLFASRGVEQGTARESEIDAELVTVTATEKAQGQRLDVFLSLSPLSSHSSHSSHSALSQTHTHSRSFFGSLCERGLVCVNARPRSKSFKVSAGDRITFPLSALAAATQRTGTGAQSLCAEDIPLDIVYEDAHLLAANKPAGMVVHPAAGSPNGTFANALLHHLGSAAASALLRACRGNETNDSSGDSGGNGYQEEEGNALFREELLSDVEDDDEYNDEEYDDIDEYEDMEDGNDENEREIGKERDSERRRLSLDLPETPEAAKASPVSLRPGIVHRLDKGTTGVLLAAKHPLAVERLARVFVSREIVKTYLAVCVGHPGEVSIHTRIGRCKKNRQLMTVVEAPLGKHAVSHVRTIAFDGKLSVCLVRIETGRTHQIRVHLKDRRTPILGDESYGSKDWNQRYRRTVSPPLSRPLLHAYSVEFTHPFTGEHMRLRAPIPPDMRTLVAKISSNTMQTLLAQPQTQTQTQRLVDEDSGLLLCDTAVVSDAERAREEEKEMQRMRFSASTSKGTPVDNVFRKRESAMRGYVPLDRLRLQEEDWTSISLPEDEEFFRQ